MNPAPAGRIGGGVRRTRDRMCAAVQEVMHARRMCVRAMLVAEGWVLDSPERRLLEDMLLAQTLKGRS
jgi:hypothetical protein